MTSNQDWAAPDTCVPTDLVVDLAHLELVVAKLADLRISAGRVEPSAELGLALLGDLHGETDLGTGLDTGLDTGFAPDTVLARLRSEFEGQFGGWAPELGKNRYLAGQPASTGMPTGSAPAAGLTPDALTPDAPAAVEAFDPQPMIRIEANAHGGRFRVCGPAGPPVDGPGSGKVMDEAAGADGVAMPTGGGAGKVMSGAAAGGPAVPTGPGSGKVMSGAAAAVASGPGSGKVMEGAVGAPDAAMPTGPGSGKVMVVEGWWSAGGGFTVNPPQFLTATGEAVGGDGAPMTTTVGVLAAAGTGDHTESLAQHAPDATFDVRTLEPAHPGGVTAWQVANAMVGFGVDVLLVPLACRTADGKPPLVLARAAERLRRSVLVVSGASAEPTWPAALPGVVAVGEHDSPWVTVTAPDAAAVCGQIAAGTTPGVKSARQALEELLSAGVGVVGVSG